MGLANGSYRGERRKGSEVVEQVRLGEIVSFKTGKFRYVTQETFDRLRCTEIVPGDILISRMPKPTGRAWLVYKMPWRMITAVDVAIAKVNSSIANSMFLVHHLNLPETIALVEKHQIGTTRPTVYQHIYDSYYGVGKSVYS